MCEFEGPMCTGELLGEKASVSYFHSRFIYPASCDSRLEALLDLRHGKE